MATVRLENLRKTFDSGRLVAVDDVSLSVDDGEFLTVVGPSGCGKSTTLRMIAGLERPTSGSVVIGGEDVTDQHARKRDVAMVFQNYALYPHKTVMGNMEFGLRMSTDLSKEERRERVRETAEMMDIEELLEDKPSELSGGQKQRVALGRAIVREPDVFLFDEPLSNLDAKLRTSMRTEIQRLQDELDITAIYVTHDQEEAMTMGDTIAILDDGELQQTGRPTDVYDDPTNEFVGGFVGSPSMNVLDAVVDNTDAGVTLRGVSADFAYGLSQEFADVLEGVEEVRMGIRPEDVEIASEGQAGTVPAEVDVVEPVGSDNYLYVDIGSEDCTVRTPASVRPGEGEMVQLNFLEESVHIFDAESGENLFDIDERLGSSSQLHTAQQT